MSNISHWVAELEEGCWLADMDGDPGRTLVKANAQQFKNAYDAQLAIEEARKFRPFVNAKPVQVVVKNDE